jgi:hypothetical protein
MNNGTSWILMLSLFFSSCNNQQPKFAEPVPTQPVNQTQPVYLSQPVQNPTPPASVIHNAPHLHSYSLNGNDDCGIADGTYNSSVEYYNPATGYRNSYTLDVVVDNCEVVEIDFPKGGWLDSDHIDAAGIDEDGTAEVADDRGRTFEVHINLDHIDSENKHSDDDIKTDEPKNEEPDDSEKPDEPEDSNQ